MKANYLSLQWRGPVLLLTLILIMASFAAAQDARRSRKVGLFPIETGKTAWKQPGFPEETARLVATGTGGVLFAGTDSGLFRYEKGSWEAVPDAPAEKVSLLAIRGEEAWFVSAGILRVAVSKSVKTAAAIPVGIPRRLAVSPDGRQVWLAMEEGLFRLQGSDWRKEDGWTVCAPDHGKLRDVCLGPQGQLALAAEGGLFLLSSDGAWQKSNPYRGTRSWAPRDVRAVAYDSRGRLWFACPQGVGSWDGREWSLYTGREGLPYNDFTTMAAGENGVVWFGTHLGAIRFDGQDWEYRQGKRWMRGDDVLSLAVDAGGNCWMATDKGLSAIERKPILLRQKADYYEKEIDLRHRRTPYGYVLGVSLPRTGDKSDWTQHDSDNDGLWTSMYGAGECYAFAATGKEVYRQKARAAFEALRFLGSVTQGGTPGAPPGFVARTVLPYSAGDPNKTAYTREKDERTRATRDRLWKILVPRWPLSADRQWYWKTDTSSDELDGHYFFYARYFDLVAGTPEERKAVQDHVRSLTDHLLAHNFTLTDWDGKPTRWAIFNPQSLNDDPSWWEERGMNSLSILSYLKTAEHITGDSKYRQAAKELVEKYGYAANSLIPKNNAGPGAGNQSDDEMVFMCYYNLLLYEDNPALIQRYAKGFASRWEMERPELCPLFNFLAASVLEGKSYVTSHETENLSPEGPWLDESIDTLQRFPLDLVDWRLTNSHRTDVILLPDYSNDGEGSRGRGMRYNGRVLKVDERFVDHWNHDPWRLNQGGNGNYLADGAGFLLPYYMGLYHKFIEEP